MRRRRAAPLQREAKVTEDRDYVEPNDRERRRLSALVARKGLTWYDRRHHAPSGDLRVKIIELKRRETSVAVIRTGIAYIAFATALVLTAAQLTGGFGRLTAVAHRRRSGRNLSTIVWLTSALRGASGTTASAGANASSASVNRAPARSGRAGRSTGATVTSTAPTTGRSRSPLTRWPAARATATSSSRRAARTCRSSAAPKRSWSLGATGVSGGIPPARILSDYTDTAGIVSLDTYGDLNLSYENVNATLVFTDPANISWNVHFIDLVEELADVRAQPDSSWFQWYLHITLREA